MSLRITFRPPTALIELQPGAHMVVSTHRYYLYDSEMDASVTERIERDIMQEHFESRKVATYVFELCQRMRANPEAPWTDKQRTQLAKHGRFNSVDEIQQAWEANRDRGTEMHKTIELLLTRKCKLSDPRVQTPEVEQFLRLYRDWLTREYDVIATEAPIVMPAISTGGTIDAICRRKDAKNRHEVMLVDWKKIPPVEMDWSRPLCEMFLLPKCTRAKHEIQLNLYADMIEAMTDYRVTRMVVVYMDAENGMDKIDVPRRAETKLYIDTLRKRYLRPLLIQADAVKHERTK